MSTEFIFIAGAFIFAGTVYGAVMAGGFALRMTMLDQNRDREPPEDADD